MKTYLINRLKEPSSWAAITAIGVLFGLPSEALNLVGQVGAGVAGLLAFALPEKS